MSAADKPVVGYIGLGDMGAAMALNLIDRGWPLALWARREVTLDPFRGTSARLCASAAEVGAVSEVLCLCVVDAAQIDEVLFGPSGAAQAMRPGTTVLIHSTIAPEDSRRFAERLAPLGIGLMDAPVTGAAARGRDGTLTIPLGGEAEVVERCRPLLDAMGTVIALGPVGSGQIGKLLNNGLFIIQVSLVDEIRRAGTALGLDPVKVLEVINSGTAASWAAGFHAGTGREGKAVWSAYETTYPGGVIEIVRKDIGLFGKQLEAAGMGDGRLAGIAADAVDSMPA